MIIKILVYLFYFLLAYKIGYHLGKVRGFKKAKHSIFVEELENSLKEGKCSLCKREFKTGK